MKSTFLAKLFKALACEKRLAIVKLLLNKRCCVGSIASELEASQSSVSQHLRVLRDSGLVTDHRCGYHIHYTVNTELLKSMTDTVSAMLLEDINGAECPKKGESCVMVKTSAAVNSLTS